MKNFVSSALLLIVKVAERPRALSDASLPPDDRQLPVLPAAFVVEPAHQ